MGWFRCVFFALFGFLSVYASDDALRSQMDLQLDIAKSIFEVRYAPAEWKRSNRGWDIEQSVRVAKDQVASLCPPTVKDFQRILRDFFHSCQDYHVDAFFYSTESAALPFKVKYVDGKLLICQVDSKKLPVQLYPWELGDELTLFDGRPANEVFEEIRLQELGRGHLSTDQALAADILTRRSGMLGHRVPSGSIEVGIRSYRRGIERFYYVPWAYTPEKVHCRKVRKDVQKGDNPWLELFKNEMILPRYAVEAQMAAPGEPKKDRHSLGARQSFLPKLGSVWWAAPDYFLFDAYLFELPDHRRAGYIRIPHFRGSQKHVDHFGLLIDFFQKNADVLVIDQLNNPGGSPVYLYALASMLTDQPLDTPKHRLSLTYHEAASAATMVPLLEQVETDLQAQQLIGNTIDGYPVNLQMARNLKNYLNFIDEQWNAGKLLSDLTHIYGIDKVMPHKNFQFTKPILVLVNSLDFSGGDFFPALLQDNQRAVIFGERTAGAGGMFSTYSHPNPFGIRCYHLTISIAERENEMTIENVGVKPDIECSLTEKDLQTNYEIYKNRILQVLEGMGYGRTSADQ